MMVDALVYHHCSYGCVYKYKKACFQKKAIQLWPPIIGRQAKLVWAPTVSSITTRKTLNSTKLQVYKYFKLKFTQQ